MRPAEGFLGEAGKLDALVDYEHEARGEAELDVEHETRALVDAAPRLGDELLVVVAVAPLVLEASL